MTTKTIKKPLTGHYSEDKQNVLVYGQKSINELKILGNFGETLKDATRKDTKRRGASDKYLTESHQDLTDSEVLVLSLEESFFLAHAFGCLSIADECSDDEVGLKIIWDRFCQQCPEFPFYYAVYYYFKCRNWIVKNGSNYGTHFILYKEGPSLDHSLYAVLVIPVNDNDDETTKLQWQPLTTIHRVVKSVRKELLLTFVTRPKDTTNPSCIQNIGVLTKVYCRLSATLQDKDISL